MTSKARISSLLKGAISKPIRSSHKFTLSFKNLSPIATSSVKEETISICAKAARDMSSPIYNFGPTMRSDLIWDRFLAWLGKQLQCVAFLPFYIKASYSISIYGSFSDKIIFL